MNQHLVSRVLLARFSDERRGPICRLDLDTLTICTQTPKKFGGVEDLVPGPEELEQIWNSEVEMRLPHASDLLDQRRVLDDPAVIETVKKCIALHWARSRMIVALVERMRPMYADRIVHRLLVEILNALQVRGAYREVCFRPGSGLREILIGGPTPPSDS